MKGIILAGGSGKRLNPITYVVNKQLLPVYDKPLIYYPLSTLMLANIKEILIISTSEHIDKFEKLLNNGNEFGIQINYKIQEKPSGIAESLILGEEFLSGSKSALILGDNIFHGPGLGRRLFGFSSINGAQIFGYRVQNTADYGIATVNQSNEVTALEEKPLNSISKIAIPGLYFFDESAPALAKKLTPSSRGEIEIIDLLKIYLQNKNLKLEMLPRGTAWFDSGTFHNLHEAGTYIKIIQDRTGERVGDPYEVAKLFGWVS